MSLKSALKVIGQSGFHPEKKLWSRSRDQLVDVVEPQVSRDKQTLTINLGVAHRRVYWLCWGKEYEPAVGEPFCVVRRRLGVLARGVDHWWPNSDDGVQSAVNAIESEGLKFLDSIRNEKDLLNAIEGNAGVAADPFAAVHRALLKYLIGDVAVAEAELLNLCSGSVGPWRSRVLEILERLRTLGSENISV